MQQAFYSRPYEPQGRPRFCPPPPRFCPPLMVDIFLRWKGSSPPPRFFPPIRPRVPCPPRESSSSSFILRIARRAACETRSCMTSTISWLHSYLGGQRMDATHCVACVDGRWVDGWCGRRVSISMGGARARYAAERCERRGGRVTNERNRTHCGSFFSMSASMR